MSSLERAGCVAGELTVQTLASLLEGEIVAIILDGVFPPGACERACHKVRVVTARVEPQPSSGVILAGTSNGDAHTSMKVFERYLADAEHTEQIARELVFDGATPIDSIVQKMIAVWAPGIRIPFIGQRRFLSQIIRRWKTGGAVHPHFDRSEGPLLSQFGFSRRLGINVYLEMPTAGGALEFWSRTFTDDQYREVMRPDFGVDRNVLGPPDFATRPLPGQAILFDASRLHAVEAIGGEGERITNSAFFGYAGPEKPMFLFA